MKNVSFLTCRWFSDVSKKKKNFNPFHHDPDGSKQQWRQHLTWINHSSSFSNFQSPNPKNIVYKTPKKKSLTYLDCWISLIHLTFFKLLCLNKFSIVEEKEPVPFLVFLKKKKSRNGIEYHHKQKFNTLYLSSLYSIVQSP